MLELAPSAEQQVLSLIRHYRRKHRFEAEYRLIKTLEDAASVVQRGTAKFHPAPPRYPSVAKYGLLWFKEWHYWIAITSGENRQFVALFSMKRPIFHGRWRGRALHDLWRHAVGPHGLVS